MSTRGCIARSTGEGTFKGVYHHWDGYPTALGATLWKLYHGHFKRDLGGMLTFLIERHPAGWSTINNADFKLPAGYQEAKYRKKRNGDDDYSKPIPHGPVCYCHGGRHEGASPITEEGRLRHGVGLRLRHRKEAHACAGARLCRRIRYRRQARTSAASTWSGCSAAALRDTSAGRT